MNLRKYLFTSSFIATIAVVFVLLIAAGYAMILEEQYGLYKNNNQQPSALCIQLEENGVCRTLNEVTCQQVCLSPFKAGRYSEIAGGHCSFEKCSGGDNVNRYSGGATGDCRQQTKVLDDGQQINAVCCCDTNDVNVNTNINQPLVGNDKDVHGCIGSAGYSWCEPKQKCLRVWEETCYKDVKQEIQYLLAKKYNKLISDVLIGIIKMTDGYVLGSVRFIFEDLPILGEGGMFLAAKQDGIWTLVYDGNGSINCKEIKQQYNFPDEMLTGFCD